MPNRDLASHVNAVSSITPRSATAVVNGAGVDQSSYESMTVLIDLGVFAGTTPSATIEIQESDDNSAFAAVAAANLIGGALPTIDTTTDEQVLERGYRGSKRYLRVAITAISGTGPSLPISAVVVRGNPSNVPS